MKLKFLFLITCLFSVNAFAQEKNFSVEISLKENNRALIGKDNLVNVKITNDSEQLLLKTENIESIILFMSRCPKIRKCDTREDVYVAYSEIKPKNFKQNEALEFHVNLADLYWKPFISSNIDFKNPKNFNTVPFVNKYLYAVIKIFDKYLKFEKQPIEIPISKSYESNEIILTSRQ